MALQGYDISLEIARTGLNKLLLTLEQSSLWIKEYKGDQSYQWPKGFLTHITYNVRLSNIRVRPDSEQESRVVSSIALLVNIQGNVLIESSLDNQQLISHPIELTGVLLVVVNFDLHTHNNARRVAITFR